MLSLAGVCFAVAATAAAGRRPRWRLAVCVLLALFALSTNLAAFGATRGLVITLVLAMSAASGLVFLLPPRPRLALPAAGFGAASGLLIVMTHLATS